MGTITRTQISRITICDMCRKTVEVPGSNHTSSPDPEGWMFVTAKRAREKDFKGAVCPDCAVRYGFAAFYSRLESGASTDAAWGDAE